MFYLYFLYQSQSLLEQSYSHPTQCSRWIISLFLFGHTMQHVRSWIPWPGIEPTSLRWSLIAGPPGKSHGYIIFLSMLIFGDTESTYDVIPDYYIQGIYLCIYSANICWACPVGWEQIQALPHARDSVVSNLWHMSSDRVYVLVEEDIQQISVRVYSVKCCEDRGEEDGAWWWSLRCFCRMSEGLFEDSVLFSLIFLFWSFDILVFLTL